MGFSAVSFNKSDICYKHQECYWNLTEIFPQRGQQPRPATPDTMWQLPAVCTLITLTVRTKWLISEVPRVQGINIICACETRLHRDIQDHPQNPWRGMWWWYSNYSQRSCYPRDLEILNVPFKWTVKKTQAIDCVEVTVTLALLKFRRQLKVATKL